MERRRYLQAAGSAVAVSLLAGCSDTLSDLETEAPERDNREPAARDPSGGETTTARRTQVVETDEPLTPSEPDEPRETVQETPTHLISLSGNTALDLDVDNPELVARTYAQSTREYGPTELRLKIPTALHEYYDSRTRIGEYGAYVSDVYDDTYINEVVGAFEEGENSDNEIINQMISFVQNLEYSTDEVSEGFNEYPKFPIETLWDKGGDCEDTVILLASMLEEFGYGVVLLGLFDRNHMALGLSGEDSVEGSYYESGGNRYYYVETTAAGWQVGQVPDDMQGASAEIIQINSHPVLVFGYTVLPTPGGVELDCKMRNVGDAVANAASMQVIFETPHGRRVAAQQTSDKRIAPEQSITETLNLSVPVDQALRINARCALGNTLHDEFVTDVARPS